MNLIVSSIFSVCFVQSCQTVLARKQDGTPSLDSVIVAEIDAICSNIKEIPALQISKSNEDLIASLKKFRRKTRENGSIKAAWSFIALSLKGPVCDAQEMNLSHMSDTNEDGSNESGITVEKMQKVRQKLSKLLTSEQTDRAMVILHGLRAEATAKEKHATVFHQQNFRLKLNVWIRRRRPKVCSRCEMI